MSEVKMPSSSLNLPSNSNAQPKPIAERPKAKKVVKEKVITKKRGIGRRLSDIFFGEEVVDVKSYILQDVLIPSIKDMISDIITGGSDMLLFGDRRRRGSGRPGQTYTNYGSYYGSSRVDNKRSNDTQHSRSHQYVKDIIFKSRGAAEEVLGNMFDYIKDYECVSVAELYEMVDEPGSFIDNDWGWYDLGSASVRRVRNGYLLVLPKVVSLK